MTPAPAPAPHGRRIPRSRPVRHPRRTAGRPARLHGGRRPRAGAPAARLRQRPAHADRAGPRHLDGRAALRAHARLSPRLLHRQPRLGRLAGAHVAWSPSPPTAGRSPSRSRARATPTWPAPSSTTRATSATSSSAPRPARRRRASRPAQSAASSWRPAACASGRSSTSSAPCEPSAGWTSPRRTCRLAGWNRTGAIPARCAAPTRRRRRAMIAEVDAVIEAGDSIGGSFVVVAEGMPVGIGSNAEWDTRLDTAIAAALMGIQAVKGVEIGLGFGVVGRRGSEVHDEVAARRARAGQRKTNRAGGTEGGMSNGAAIVARVAVKPVSTLRKPLDSVDLAHRRGAARPHRAQRRGHPAAGGGRGRGHAGAGAGRCPAGRPRRRHDGRPAGSGAPAPAPLRRAARRAHSRAADRRTRRARRAPGDARHWPPPGRRDGRLMVAAPSSVLTFRLLGQGIAYSASPAMMTAAFAALGLPHRYVLADVAADELPAAVAASARRRRRRGQRDRPAQGGRGGARRRAQRRRSPGRCGQHGRARWRPAGRPQHGPAGHGRCHRAGSARMAWAGPSSSGPAAPGAPSSSRSQTIGAGHVSVLRRSDGSMDRLADELAAADLLVNATPVGTGSDESPVPARRSSTRPRRARPRLPAQPDAPRARGPRGWGAGRGRGGHPARPGLAIARALAGPAGAGRRHARGARAELGGRSDA